MGTQDELRRGYDALASGDWALAEKLFDEAVQDDPTPEALDGLGRARWWRKDVRSAMELRTGAHRGFKAEGRTLQAAMVAVWLAREHRTLFHNDAAADGWLARARTLVGTDSPVAGWVALADAEATTDPLYAIQHARTALDLARQLGDANLEVVALARLGLLHVAQGDVDTGIGLLDEAMAGAASGEPTDLQSVATAYCLLLEAGELLGDTARFAQWTATMSSAGSGQGLGPLQSLAPAVAYGNLSVFCGACCGGMHLVTGRLDDAEGELLTAIEELEAGGMTSRCVHPVTQLAELRVLQGRIEEARVLLAPYEDLPEAVRPLALLDLSLGEPESAVARLTAQLHRTDHLPVATFPLLTTLADAEIAMGRLDAADRTAARLTTIAAVTGSRRHRGEALLASGKVAAAAGRPDAANLLRDAGAVLGAASMALPACRARMALARTLVDSDRPVAVTEARAALAAFDRLGAGPDADDAAAFLRDLGVRGRTGPKGHEPLSKREVEVLRLVAQGLSNPEIAGRLFISTKTAGHHVSSILAKLGLRSRTEAAAYAAVHPLSEPASK
jgi:DNA-binding CsgD family transcriptional regulator/tetratricopeptide (TPR) repeat protein